MNFFGIHVCMDEIRMLFMVGGPIMAGLAYVWRSLRHRNHNNRNTCKVKEAMDTCCHDESKRP